MNVAFNYGYWDLWQLYHKVTFDGANRIIYVNDSVTELNIKSDLYSDWKEWTGSMPDNAVWAPAIRSIGGDPTLEGQTAGDIYFLQNGWKLYIDLTKVRVSGILFSDDYESPYYDYTGTIQYPAQVSSLVSGFERVRVPALEDIWGYSSRTLTQQIASDAPTVEEISQAVWSYITRSLTEGAGTSPQEIWEYNNRTLTTDAAPSVEEIWSATSRTLTENPGPTAAEIADSVWDESYADHDTDGTMGHLLNYSKQLQKSIWVNTELTNGDGSQENPYNNIQDAVDRAENDNIRTIYLIGDVTLTKNFKNFYLIGIGVPEVDLNGQDIRNSHFTEVALKGSFVNGSNIVIRDSLLLDGAYLDGFIENSALGGDLICSPNSAVFMKGCASAIPGTNRPTISMNPAATSQLSVRGYNGGLTILDCNQSTDRVTVELSAGSLTFDSSCTNGIMVARGVGKFVDNTNGAAVFDETINQEMLDTLEALATNIQSTTNTINTNTDTVEADIAAVQAAVDTINSNTGTISTDLSTIQNTLNTVNTNTDTLEAGVSNLASDNIRIEQKLDVIDTNLDSTLAKATTIETTTNSTNNVVGLVQASVDAINLNTDTVETGIAALQSSVLGIEQEVDLNASKLDTINATTSTINTNTANLQSTLDGLNIDITPLEVDIAAVQSTVDTINSNTITLQSSVNSINLNTDTVEAGIASLQVSVLGIEQEVDSNASKLDAINSSTSSANSALNNITPLVTDTNTKVSTINNNTAPLESKLDSVTTTINSIDSSTTIIETLANTINTNTDTLEASVSGLVSKVDNVDTKVTSIVGYTGNLQVSIDAVNTEVEANQTLLNTLQSALSIVGTDVSTIDTKVDTISTTTQSTNTEVLSKLLEVWRILGLDTNNPQLITDVSITVGDITLSIGQPDLSTTSVTRQ